MEGNTALGASSPANPALHIPEPLSTTKAATSSSHIVEGGLNLKAGNGPVIIYGWGVEGRWGEGVSFTHSRAIVDYQGCYFIVTHCGGFKSKCRQRTSHYLWLGGGVGGWWGVGSALHIPDPLSTTKAATSSSHIVLVGYLYVKGVLIFYVTCMGGRSN